MSLISVKTYTLGMWMTNSYVVSSEGSDKCWIIDAGFEPGVMIEDIKKSGLSPEMLIYTHAHLDHIAGTDAVKNEFPEIKTAVAEDESDFLTDPSLNLSSSAGMNVSVDQADIILTEDTELELNGNKFKIFHTPGHSPGGICLYQEENNILFSGDTLFKGSVGRYDFPSSDGRKLIQAIKDKLLSLPEVTVVYPGHGEKTLIGDEKKNNPFL